MERLIEEGWDPGEARAEAEQRFGDVDRWRAQTEAARRGPLGRGRGMAGLGTMGQDVRYAVRQIRRHPVFSAVTILTLGAGIGVNTAIFGAAKQAVRPELPFGDSDRLVRLYQVPEAGSPRLSPRVPVFLALQDGADAFESVAGSRFTDFTLDTAEGPERAIGNAITPGWLRTIGVQPVLGRSFSPEEEAQGESSPVVLISHGAWQDRFGGAADVLGRTIRMNGVARSVVGVLPAGFNHPYNAQFWIPLNPLTDQGGFWALNLKGRLREGRTLPRVAQELESLSRAIEGTTPGFNVGMTLTAVPIREALVGDDSRTLSALMIAVGVLLLIVCANVANLLVSRSVARRSEFAVRASLGASRGRLLRQSTTETLVLGVLGGLLGLAVGAMGLQAMGSMMPENLLRLGVTPRLDGLVLLVSLSAAVATGLMVGILPGLGLSGAGVSSTLRAGVRSLTRRADRRLGKSLAVGELAVTLMLLTAVGLLARDFQTRRGVDLGYDPDDAVVFTIGLDGERYGEGDAREAFVDGLARELVAVPGVTAAGATNMFPRHQGNVVAQLESEEVPAVDGNGVTVNHRVVSSGYLDAMDIALLEGRPIDRTDVAGSPPVAVVSRSLAQRLWPEQSPVGRRARNLRSGAEAGWLTVVGVVEDALESDDIQPTWYLPYSQHTDSRETAQVTFLVRGSATGGIPGGREIRQAVARVDGQLPIYDLMTTAAVNDQNLASARQGVWVGGLFAAFGLALAALGIYGTITYSVGRRVREFGVRLALGSGRSGILGLVLREVMTLVGLGGLLGLIGALGVAKLLESFLVEIGAFDLAAFLGATGMVSLVALLAGLAPARRATRTDPIEALRSE